MNKSLELIFLFFILILTGLNSLQAQWSILDTDTTKHVPSYLTQKFSASEWNASNFASADEIKWFTDARFGMFIHFGLATYIGKEISGGVCYTYKAPDFGHGLIPESIWQKYPDFLTFKQFNAKEWIETAREAGMKYVVVIVKHHDGFHLWDTHYSDFKITNTPFGRDYLREIAAECHKTGMKLGIYLSQRDWYNPYYSPVDTSLIVEIKDPPYYKAKPGISTVKPGPDHHKYVDYLFNEVRELCTNYGKVDIFWLDAAWWGGMFTADMWDSEKLTRMIRNLQPGIIINNRASLPGDFDTPELILGMYQQRPWESCYQLCQTWSWSDTPVKSPGTIIKMLTQTACANGNLLLSWGPRWEGDFDPEQVNCLAEVGKWMRQYGYTIYKTSGGPWFPEEWGGSTRRNDTAFVHITDTSIKSLSLSSGGNRIIEVKCITGGSVGYEKDKSGLKFDLTKADHNKNQIIIQIIFNKPVTGMIKKPLL
jgi:alpha-L-fucosidase